MADHGSGCECARCRGFEPGTAIGDATRFESGNDAAVTHGAKSDAKVRDRATSYLGRLRAAAPSGGDPADEFALERLARQLARADMVEEWLDENGWIDEGGAMRPAVKELASWDNSIRRLLDALGLVTVSRAQLRLDVLRGDLIEATQVQAAIVGMLSADYDLVAAIAAELLPEEVRAMFVQSFRDRQAAETLKAVEAVDARALPPAGETS